MFLRLIMVKYNTEYQALEITRCGKHYIISENICVQWYHQRYDRKTDPYTTEKFAKRIKRRNNFNSLLEYYTRWNACYKIR